MSVLRRKLEVLGDDDGTSLKVAFASTDREHVNQHFGAAMAFVVYNVNPDHISLSNIAEFEEPLDDNEDKLAEKIDLLDGCIAVYCRACGSSAVKQLLERGIQPLKVSEGALISDLLVELQQELREGPSSWLAKAVSRSFLDMTAFNWMELESSEEQ